MHDQIHGWRRVSTLPDILTPLNKQQQILKLILSRNLHTYFYFHALFTFKAEFLHNKCLHLF